MRLTVSQIHIYPVKSFSGISPSSATIDERGFAFDRRWMLIDSENRFVTQRTLPDMALFTASIKGDRVEINHKTDSSFHLSFEIGNHSGEKVNLTLFDNPGSGYLMDSQINFALSNKLKNNVKLVYMDTDIERKVNEKYSSRKRLVSYADGFPFLLLSEESLAELNSRLPFQASMLRFRPNIVIKGGEAFIEDRLKQIRINNVTFDIVKPCPRCVITTVDPTTAKKNSIVLKTLAEFRKTGNNVNFGQNLIHHNTGTISVGDEVEILNN